MVPQQLQLKFTNCTTNCVNQHTPSTLSHPLCGQLSPQRVKMVHAGYTAIYNNSKVNFYNSTTAKISVSEEAVLTGYICPRTQLWHVPLVTTVRNKNTDTLLLHHHPRKHESLNAVYTWNHIYHRGTHQLHNVSGTWQRIHPQCLRTPQH